MSGRAFDGYEIVSDERIGEGGFLTLRRVRLCVRRGDGTLSRQGLYDFVERPMGRDAVVLMLWHRPTGGAVQVLLRHAPRVPLWFRDRALGAAHTEVVAGILERGEDDWPAIQRRAAAEAHEEAGITVAPEAVERLGAPSFPTAGMFGELFHFVAAEVRDPAAAVVPPTDGSPFEEGASLEWVGLDEAIGRADDGRIVDLKTELALRRLRSKIG
ncbi:MAG TPA: NUDIX domain-containing protein [Polyangia bacterium]|nr:NUDIX domain-containing protein [Polyangia bacterium]